MTQRWTCQKGRRPPSSFPLPLGPFPACINLMRSTGYTSKVKVLYLIFVFLKINT
jgi:hypothetical protein